MNQKLILALIAIIWFVFYIWPDNKLNQSQRVDQNGNVQPKLKAYVFQVNQNQNNRVSSYFKNHPESWELLSNKNKNNIEKADLIWKGKQHDYIFKPHQWWNHTPLQDTMMHKWKFVNMLKDYSNQIKNVIEYTDILPETYSLLLNRKKFTQEEMNFFTNEKNRQYIWITKPMGGRRGEGITIITDLDKFFKDVVKQKEENDSGTQAPNQNSQQELDKYNEKLNRKKKTLIIQKYIDNPFLINGKKFDIRCYMYVSSFEPFVSFYYPGYLRRSIYDYDRENYDHTLSHLVNVSLMKHDPNYKTEAKDSLWMMDKFKEYVLQQGRFNEEDFKIFEDKILKILTFISESFLLHQNNSSQDSRNRFHIFGADIAVDENLNPCILEVNVDPQLDNPHEEVTKLQLQMLEASQSFQGSVIENQNNLTEFYKQIDANYLAQQENMQKNLILLYNQVTGYSYNQEFIISKLNDLENQQNGEL